jgi:hypothetical protein
MDESQAEESKQRRASRGEQAEESKQRRSSRGEQAPRGASRGDQAEESKHQEEQAERRACSIVLQCSVDNRIAYQSNDRAYRAC